MKVKIVLIVIAVLLLIQLWVYAAMVKDSTQTTRQDVRGLETEVAALESEAGRLQKDVVRLEEMVAAIPPDFLAGFEDPEAGFMEFLDYINEPLIQDQDVSVNMRRGPAFTNDPIPHHESQFTLSFPFVSTQETENILHFLMFQHRFPIKLTTLDLRGSGTDKASASLDLSLLIPAKYANPLASLERRVQ
jgi:hypothetical protein